MVSGDAPSRWPGAIDRFAPAIAPPRGGMQLLIHDAAGAKVHVSTLDIAGVLETAPMGVDSAASGTQQARPAR